MSRYVLRRDIVIPAGTLFSRAPIKTERFGEGHIQCDIGLSKDTSGSLTYCLDDSIDEKQFNLLMKEWFLEI